MSASSRSMNLSALVVGVVFLIAQVKCQAQGTWRPICESGSTVAWLGAHGGLLPLSYAGVPVSGRGQCLASNTGATFDLITAPTAFNFPIAGRVLLCGTSNGCASASPAPPAQVTARICSGQSVVAYISGPTNTIYPANGQGTPSGQARCTGTTSIPELTVDAVPSFPLGSNPYCAMANGDCARVA
ncbi:uncharacterized protein MELLADRAFT_71516 [Melampsora larici-populina 98AG31]|uniref:Secreted protein n=1 Tax=Melampsora larici-populina (strain 98AG31 / pathotype 3-4-7) TaxID=747676 RepID=F4RH19_MELLP|nr:uncharacterized protein MELLADRAFT_71516 [Melampsora larici-populina 98AG31]EGG08309.1 secreted protein [Melampsora larici-populina 98AG31]